MRLVSFCLIVCMLLLAAGCLQGASPPEPHQEEMLVLLSTMQDAVAGAIMRVDVATKDAARQLGRSGDTAGAVLEELAASDPSVVYTYSFDRNGTILAVVP
ncbi:MAG TPA: hypothetical protein PLV96_07635, partial [Methanoregulaceae archaeon]|nr:hypothetical protein [Methanoregulaceae archaeon]